MIELPKVIFVNDVAKAIGWSTQRTRRWLKSLGAVEKRGNKWVTTKTRLKLALPEAYEAMEEELAEENEASGNEW